MDVSRIMRYQLVVCATHPLYEFLRLLDFSHVAVETDYPSLISSYLADMARLTTGRGVEVDNRLFKVRVHNGARPKNGAGLGGDPSIGITKWVPHAPRTPLSGLHPRLCPL